MDEKAGSGAGHPADGEAEARARRRLRAEKAFYIHLAVYTAVIGGLFLVNAVTRTHWWFFWPALGWGMAILVHGAVAFGVAGFAGRDWEDTRLRELIEQERRRR